MPLSEAFPALCQTGVGVIDVGARDGLVSLSGAAAPMLDVVGFEPDVEEVRRLQATAQRASPYRSLTYLSMGLGAADGQRLLYLCRSRGTSSFYKPNPVFLDRFPDAGRYDVVGTTSVPVRSLDSLLHDPTVQMPRRIGFIKVDTQGSELDILRGAEQVLRSQVVAVEVEVLFAPLYDGPPPFREVDAFLADCGFSLFKLRRLEWVRSAAARRPHVTAGQLVFGDALYLRDPLDVKRRWVPQQPTQLEALVLFALLYDLHDFVLELIAVPEFARALEVTQLLRCIERRGRRLSSLRERLRMANMLYRGSAGWKRYASRWARGDENFYSVL